jgi:hypothetical protein
MDARKLKTITARRYWPVGPEINKINDHSMCFTNISEHKLHEKLHGLIIWNPIYATKMVTALHNCLGMTFL